MSTSSKKRTPSTAPISIDHHRLPAGSVGQYTESVRSMLVGSLPKGTPPAAKRGNIPTKQNPHKVPAHELHMYLTHSKSSEIYPWFPPFDRPPQGWTGNVWQDFRLSRLEADKKAPGDQKARFKTLEDQEKDIELEFRERCDFANIDLYVMSDSNAPGEATMVPRGIARASTPAAIDPPRLEPYGARGQLKSPRGAAAAAAKNGRKYGAPK